MYQRVLLATDETKESAIALREGALLARSYQAKVFLLVVVTHAAGALMADGIHPTPRSEDGKGLLQMGLDRLKRLGLDATGAVVVGEPAAQIGAAATKFGADLVIVGHRRQSLLDRWWSGATGGYIADYVPCSVLVARNCVSDAVFDRYLDTPTAQAELEAQQT